MLTKICKKQIKTCVRGYAIRTQEDVKALQKANVERTIARFNVLRNLGKEVEMFDYHEILFSAAKNRDPTQVKFWYELLKKDNMDPNLETFGIVLGSCCIEGNTVRGIFFMSELAHYFDTVPAKFLETMSFMLKEDSSPKEAQLFADLAKAGKPVASKVVQETIKTVLKNPKYE
eukprot:gene1757-526_t